MKTALCLLLLAGFSLPAASQDSARIRTIAEGPVFAEPDNGTARFVQLKNGYTLFTHFSPKQGLQVQLYDSAHRKLDSTLAGYPGTSLDAVFESQGHATVLISDRGAKRPLLMRLTVSAWTGKLLREDTVAFLDKVNLRKKRLESGSDFLVIKDPYSGNYAVWMYRNSELPEDEGYEVVHFAADHREISRARFASSSPDRRFRYWDMAVIGDRMLCVLGTEQNALGEMASTEMKLATLDSGNIFFRFKSLDFPKGVPVQGGFVKYHPALDQLILLQAGQREDRKTGTWLSTVRLDSMLISSAREVVPHKVNQKSQEVFGPKSDYEGVAQNVIIKPDGGYSLVFEELDNLTRMENSHPVVVSTILANLAVVDYDAEGRERGSWMIPKRQMNAGLIMKAFYQKSRENALERLNWQDQYKFFTYIPGPQRDYIFLNDLADNLARLDKGKLPLMRDARDGFGAYYTLEGKDIIPARDAVFPAQEQKKQSIGLFSIADYDAERRRMVTLKRTPEGRSGVQLVWLDIN
ncbi:hypothetical protein ACWKWU_04425 [Chitinophaga lutea]